MNGKFTSEKALYNNCLQKAVKASFRFFYDLTVCFAIPDTRTVIPFKMRAYIFVIILQNIHNFRRNNLHDHNVSI